MNNNSTIQTADCSIDSKMTSKAPIIKENTRARQISSLLLRSKNLSPYRGQQKSICNHSSGQASNRGTSSSYYKTG